MLQAHRKTWVPKLWSQNYELIQQGVFDDAKSLSECKKHNLRKRSTCCMRIVCEFLVRSVTAIEPFFQYRNTAHLLPCNSRAHFFMHETLSYWQGLETTALHICLKSYHWKNFHLLTKHEKLLSDVFEIWYIVSLIGMRAYPWVRFFSTLHSVSKLHEFQAVARPQWHAPASCQVYTWWW